MSRLVYVDRPGWRVMMPRLSAGRVTGSTAAAPPPGPKPLYVPDEEAVVVEGDGLKEVAAAFLHAKRDQEAHLKQMGGQYASSGPEDEVTLYLKPERNQARERDGETGLGGEPEPLAINVIIPAYPSPDGAAMREALTALSRWQARQVALRVRRRLRATFPDTGIAAGKGDAPSGQPPVDPTHGVSKPATAPAATPTPASQPVSRVTIQVEEHVCPPVETATDPSAVRSLLEALCHLDGRAFHWEGMGQTVYARLVAPDGTEEVLALRVAVYQEAYYPSARYPGISRAMDGPPLPRPLWDTVYTAVYGDKEP